MKLNDLTASGWVHNTKSVYKKSYGTSLDAHKTRRLNKTCKPPRLAKHFIEIFSKKDDLVLDPLSGTGGIVLGAQMAKRRAIGFELRQDFIDAYKDACDELSNLFEIFDQNAIQCGNCFDKLPELEKESIDLIATDIPYFDMDTRKKSKRRYHGKDHERPMEAFGKGFKNLEEWKNFSLELCVECCSVLKKDKYFFTFLEDMYIDGEYIFLTHIFSDMAKKAGLVPQGEFLWYNEARRPGLWGYPSRVVTSRTHTSILYFRKEK